MLRAAWRMIPRILGAWAVAFAAMALALFFFKTAEATSRVWFVLWFVLGALYLVTERQLIAYSIRRWARNGTMERRAVIAGGGEPAKELIRALEAYRRVLKINPQEESVQTIVKHLTPDVDGQDL